MKLVLVMLGASLSLMGCSSACRQLSEKQCDCLQSTFDRNSCIQRAASNDTLAQPTEADNAACQALLDQCDCRLVDTPEGKRKCGYARPPCEPGANCGT